MKSGFFYIVKDEFFETFSEMGCSFKYNKTQNRPIFCCIKDNIYPKLYWAIPTGTIENKNIDRIKTFMSYDEKDIRHSYYHIGYTNRKAIFYISSAFPITEKYILREYTSDGIPLEMKRQKLKEDITKKLLKILTYENKFPNKLETHITVIKSNLLKEIDNYK